MKRKTLREFVELLEQCRVQVEADQSGYLKNPQLYLALHRIYLHLCHGNIPDHADGGIRGGSGGEGKPGKGR